MVKAANHESFSDVRLSENTNRLKETQKTLKSHSLPSKTTIDSTLLRYFKPHQYTCGNWEW